MLFGVARSAVPLAGAARQTVRKGGTVAAAGRILRRGMAVQVRRAADRGGADLDWLTARYTFSFSRYDDPRFDNFGPLFVMNEDWVQGGKGFAKHAHRNAEIFSYILSGALRHRDSMGNVEVVGRHQVQFTSAGDGMMHSEMNAHKSERCHLLQFWLHPDTRDLEPRYDTKTFPESAKRGALCLLASKTGRDGSIRLNQDASIFACMLSTTSTPRDRPAGTRDGVHGAAAGELGDDGSEHASTVEYKFEEGRAGFIQLAQNEDAASLSVNDLVTLHPGDGAFVTDLAAVTLKAVPSASSDADAAPQTAEFLLFDLYEGTQPPKERPPSPPPSSP